MGEARPTSSLKESGVSRESILQLLVRGADNYFHRSESLMDVSIKAVEKVISESDVDRNDIDVLLLGTNSLAAPDFNDDFGHQLITKLHFKNAYVQLIGFQNCGDSVPIFRTARAMLKSGDAKTVLILIADDVTAAGVPRILKDSYLHSDGAAAALVSQNGPGYMLSNSKVLHLPASIKSIDSYDLDGNLDYLLDEAINIYQHNLGIQNVPEFVITHNMNRLYNQKVADKFEVSLDLVYGVHTLGHCLAADVLINMNVLETDGHLKGGEQGVLVVPTSRSIGVLDISYHKNNNTVSQINE